MKIIYIPDNVTTATVELVDCLRIGKHTQERECSVVDMTLLSAIFSEQAVDKSFVRGSMLLDEDCILLAGDVVLFGWKRAQRNLFKLASRGRLVHESLGIGIGDGFIIHLNPRSTILLEP